MSIVFATTVDIAATPEKVWGVLSDFPAYGEWSNFSRIVGTPTLGSKLSMRMPGFWFASTVTAATPNEELQWSARLLTSALFLGEHNFTLDRLADGTTHMKNTETFSGALTHPFEKMFATRNNEGGYVTFNQALKSRVEARSSLPVPRDGRLDAEGK